MTSLAKELRAALASAEAVVAQLRQLVLATDSPEGRIEQAAPPPVLVGLQNPVTFYDYIRGDVGELFPTMSSSQHKGVELILNACAGEMPASWAACALGTTYWETNKTMEPVEEAYWTSDEWRRRNLRYYPWYGRGYVQLSWEKNYAKADSALGLNGALLADRNLALRPDIAARILVRGMKEGWFTGKKLNDYVPAVPQMKHFINSRRIINGTDKAETIAAICMEFYKALVAGEWK